MVAQIEQFVESEALLADIIELDVNLKALAALLQMRKACLALSANGHQPPCHFHVHALLLQLLCGLGGIVRENLGD